MYRRESIISVVVITLAFYVVVSQDETYQYMIRNNNYSPFKWKKHDDFDLIMDKMTTVNEQNCMSKSPSDLVLPETAVSQLPQYNELHKNIFFGNRTKLVHMLNMALNRALFYSFIFQSQNASEIEFKNNPGLMYYFMSATADITANPGFINGSSIYFDNDCHYPNWLNTVSFNKTIRLFACSAYRVDDYNEPTNRNREPTNNTVDVQDLGAGADSNYTDTRYKNNLWYKKWLPDLSSAKDTINKFTHSIGITSSNKTGILNPKEDTLFFGPPEPKESDEVKVMPVQWTKPYFDCGRSNRWIISATSPVVDFLARYVTNHTIVRRPRIVAAVVIDTEFEKIDINQCDLGEGHEGPNLFAGTHRCKDTTTCEPLHGFGFRRGGYQCLCRPGYRLPVLQDGPFLGFELEEATEREYKYGFDCLKVYENRIFPQVKPEVVGRKNVKKTAIIYSQYDRQMNKRSVNPTFLDYVSSVVGLPRSKRASIHDSEDGPPVKLVAQKRQKREEPKVKRVTRTKRSFDQRKLERLQKDFDQEAYFRMIRLLRRMGSINGKNCDRPNIQPQMLVLPGDVTYGVDKMLEPQARVALRLAHFISNFMQNVVENEIFGVIIGDRMLHESQLWGEVMANVQADRKIKGSGVFFDRYKFRMSRPMNNTNPRFEKGVFREYFGPYAYRVYQEERRNRESTLDKYEVIDLAGLPESQRYISERWFMDMKSRWATNFYHLKKYTMRPMVRYDKTEKSRVRFEYYPMTYRAPTYEDGVWLRPTFKCDGRVKDWVVTYVAPFFGMNALRTRLDFKGVVTVDVTLDNLDMNQCPDDFNVANAFKGTARCDFETTYCVPLRGHRFNPGNYKCECKQGYEMPLLEMQYYDGATMEKEYALYVKGQPNSFETLKCRLAIASQTKLSLTLLILTVLISSIFHL